MLTIFVGGVTGSGKTTACAKFAQLLRGRSQVIHVGSIACDIAATHKLATESIEQATTYALERCQRLVVNKINEVQQLAQQDTILVLDGHFVLGGIDRPPYCMPEWFFSDLGVSRLVLCAPTVAKIRSRIDADLQRIRPELIVNSLDYYAELEARHACFIAEKCSISLKIIETGDEIMSVIPFSAI